MNVKIVVTTHKPYRMPSEDLYLPVHVGAANKPDLGYTRDDSGDNISEKNKNYCELTGLYWAWKNLDAECIGLAHYRRHFSVKPKRDKWVSVLKRDELENLLADCDVILPKPRD